MRYSYSELSFILSTLLKLDYSMLSACERKALQETINLLEVMATLEEKAKLDDEQEADDE